MVDMTLTEIKEQMTALIDAAFECGSNATTSVYEAKIADIEREYKQHLDEAVKEAEERAYKQGHADALASLQIEPKTEDEAEAETGTEQPGAANDGHVGDEPKVIVANVTNAAVAGFVADPSYAVPGFATSDGKSVVMDYARGNIKEGSYIENWPEQPDPVNVGGKTYRNLVPGREYELDGQRVRVTGSVRQIQFTADKPVANCRDLGGWPCEGGHVAYGKVIRSAYLPDGLTPDSDSAKILRDEVGVTCEIDLRGKYAYTTLGWTGVKAGTYGYAAMLTKTTYVKSVFTRILTETEKGGCVLLHCNAGADRTGTIVAVLLGVLGVPAWRIVQDWELTSFCHWFNFKIIGQWEERVNDPEMEAVARKEFPDGELRAFFRAMEAAYGANGETFQQQCTAYLTKKVGFTAAQIERLKKALVEGEGVDGIDA